MPHFFISSKNINHDTILVDDRENYNHIAKSLRIRRGEPLLFIDENQIQYETIVKEITSSSISADILNKYKSIRKLPFNIYLAQSPLRSDAQSFVIEKATELGIKGIFPVQTDNCAVSRENIEKKIEKWQKIMKEASKQCERADIPICFAPESLENLIKRFDKIIVFCERIAEKTLKDVESIKDNQDVLVIIGPEGGFSEREFLLFKNSNVEMITLGDLILKAETAVTVGLGNIIYEFTSRN